MENKMIDSLTDKLKTWHLIAVLILQIFGYIYAVGSKSAVIEDTITTVKLHTKQIDVIKEQLVDVRLSDQKISQLNKKIERLSNQLDDFQKELLEIYKAK